MKILMIAMWVVCAVMLVNSLINHNFVTAIWVGITAMWVGNTWMWHSRGTKSERR